MARFWVDDGFSDSRVVMDIDEKIRNECVGLWTRCGAWAAKEETDGVVPMEIVRAFAGRRTRQLLVGLSEQTTLFEPPKPREVMFRNWSKWQKTHAELVAERMRAEEMRQAATERKRNERRRKGRNSVTLPATTDVTRDIESDVTPDTDETVTRDVTQDPSRVRVPRAHVRPDPTRPDPNNSLVTFSGGVTSVDARENPPPQTQSQEPNRPALSIRSETDKPCRACQHARHRLEAWKSEQAAAKAERGAALRAVIDACEFCDERGMRSVGEDSLTRCTHDPATFDVEEPR